MMSVPFVIRAETPSDAPEIDSLLDVAFGPGRFAKTAYRLREGVPHDPRLSFVAIAGDGLVGSVRLTGIRIGDNPALLLGPLAVAPHFANRGAGRELVRTSLDAARSDGHRLVLLVGDLPYYGPLGFAPVPPGQVEMPGPVDPARLLACALVQGADGQARGLARRLSPGGA
jgi:predicted N-acetyltransferase YhbS